MSRIGIGLRVLAVLALLAGLAVATPAAYGTQPNSAALAPMAAAAIGDDCPIASSYPGGYKLCGYHQDGPWLFPSGRSVTCWAGLQLRYTANVGHEFRVWHKCHAVGVQGTIVSSTVRWENIRRILWQKDRKTASDVATACQSGCTKTDTDVYWWGMWQLAERYLIDNDFGWSTDAHVVVHINNTDDVTSDHCVSSYKWYPLTADSVPVC
jgi:hypothetical protein